MKDTRKHVGRPKGSTKQQKRVAVTIRLRVPFLELLKKIAAKQDDSQARVLEDGLTRYAKSLGI